MLFWLLLAGSAYVLFAPGDSAPALFPHADLVVHLTMFATLALAGRGAGWPPGPLAAALAAYAVGSELVQSSALVSDRAGSASDVVADGVGIAAGLLLSAAIPRRLSRR